MKKIPTVREYYAKCRSDWDVNGDYPPADPFKFAIEFAKLHVKAALKAAVKKAKIVDDKSFWSGQAWDDGPLPQIVDKNSILNAYPEKNIQ